MSVLIVKLGALGDVVMATGVLRAIQDHHAGSPLTLLTADDYAGLFRNWTGLRVAAFPRRGWRSALAMLRFVRRGRFFRIYDLQSNDRTAVLCALSGAVERVGNHPRCNILYDPSHFMLQQLDYLGFIDVYAPRIKMFHVKDAEFNPSPKQGVYSGYQSWVNRAGRFRSLGDGQIDFGAIFSKLAAYDYEGWAVLEWECCLKHPEDGAAEGAPFIRDHIIRVTERAFVDFAGSGSDEAANRRILGISG